MALVLKNAFNVEALSIKGLNGNLNIILYRKSRSTLKYWCPLCIIYILYYRDCPLNTYIVWWWNVHTSDYPFLVSCYWLHENVYQYMTDKQFGNGAICLHLLCTSGKRHLCRRHCVLEMRLERLNCSVVLYYLNVCYIFLIHILYRITVGAFIGI